MNKHSKKFPLRTTLCSIAIFSCLSIADESTISKASSQNDFSYKMLSYNYTDNNFENLHSIVSNQTVSSISNTIGSTHFIGTLNPKVSGNYKFSTSHTMHFEIFIDGKKITSSSQSQAVYLSKNKDYPVRINYKNIKNSTPSVRIFWKRDNTFWSEISKEVLFYPSYEPSDFSKSAILSSQDVDNDGIPNLWETNGYTVIDNKIVSWNQEYSDKGYIKYLSNPTSAYTSRDPYTDLEKVLGNVPISTKPEARDPLVAAYPAVTVNMKKLHMSKNENVGSSQSGTISTDVSQTLGVTNSVGINGDFGISPEGITAKVSANYTHSWTNSHTFSSSTSNSWSKSLSMNTVDAAFLNANVQYVNTGSAPIYQVKPTTNLKLQKQDLALSTIKAGSNFSANVLNAGGTYPSGDSTIALDKVNEIGSVRINVNANQLDSLQSNEENLILETHQTEGFFAKKNPDGSFNFRAGTWDEVRNDIDNTSASLTLETGKEILERRVTTKDLRDNLDQTPILTIREAIQKAFDAHKKEDGKWYYQSRQASDHSHTNPILLAEEALNIVIDEYTSTKLQEQLKNKPNSSIFDLHLIRGMKLTFVVPQKYMHFENKNDWSYSYHINGGYKDNKALQTPYRSFSGEALHLKPHTTYSIRAMIRSNKNTSEKNVRLATYNTNPNYTSSEKSIRISDNWSLIETVFNTGHKPEDYKKIMLENTSIKDSIIFDDVVVQEWSTSSYNNILKWVYKPLSSENTEQNISHLRSLTVPLNYKNKDNQAVIDLLIQEMNGIPLDLKNNYSVRLSDSNVVTLDNDSINKKTLSLNIKKKGTSILSIVNSKNNVIVRSIAITVGDVEDQIVKVDDDRYTLSSILQPSLDIVMKDNRSIMTWKKEPTGNHQWEINYNSTKGAYQIKNGRDTSLVLTAISKDNKVNAKAALNTDSDHQYWYIYDAGDNYVYLINKSNGLALSTDGYTFYRNMSLKEFKRTANQKIKLNKLK